MTVEENLFFPLLGGTFYANLCEEIFFSVKCWVSMVKFIFSEKPILYTLINNYSLKSM